MGNMIGNNEVRSNMKCGTKERRLVVVRAMKVG